MYVRLSSLTNDLVRLESQPFEGVKTLDSAPQLRLLNHKGHKGHKEATKFLFAFVIFVVPLLRKNLRAVQRF